MTKTMQTLDTLEAVCAVFEKAGDNLNVDISEWDIVNAEVRAAMEEFNQAEQNQKRMRRVLHYSVQFKESCRRLEDASKKIPEKMESR